ncbi:hypothetical protein [Luteimonas sp. FCS-9]|uniref:hypothetical protein n=1 Tax=Luteimonas sp. FCS-9 TaxID=1547516 RepID=UPI00063E8A34|nr:hypothetical protein [Luteimonas sp. FCS-9]KLJ01137.1 hypothetical protein WQ56_07205 [Luteimonas sp. FCS-9]
MSGAVAPARPPTAAQLATLGTVLCLHRPGTASELGGWSRARRVEAHRALDGDGMRESLWFFDADDVCCWQLHLLPDSDFLGWEALASRFPVRAEAVQGGLAERLWQGLAQRLRAGGWQASVLRFHALAHACTTIDGAPMLVASLAAISPLGGDCARRIVRAHGIVPATAIEDRGGRRAAVGPVGVRAIDAAAASRSAPGGPIPFPTRSGELA